MRAFRATTRSLGGSRFETDVGSHSLLTDHSGVGPTPPDYFAASLAACVAVYVSGYCRRAGIDATGLTVELECDKGEHVMSNFRIAVHLPDAELGSRAAAIQRVAGACLVHATIKAFGDCPISVLDRMSELAPVN